MIRLIFIIILLLISLLAICKAPEYHLWFLAIGVTEFPWFFVIMTLLALGSGFWVSHYNLAGTVTGVAALLLFISPVARAYVVAGNLPGDLDASFGITKPGNTNGPFSFFNMFSGNAKQAFRTFTYAEYADTSLKLDYYPALSEDFRVGRPCVIIIHGGAWSSGDSRQLTELNSYLAIRGYNVAAINYRMVPKWQNPAPVEDVANAIKYLKVHANELHIDTNKFVLLGRSAGAQVALLAGYTLHDKGIKGVIDFYGPADMVWGYSVPANPLVMDSRKVMEDYIGGTYTQVPQKYAASSPIEYVNSQSPPTLIIHGANDVLWLMNTAGD